MNGGDQPWVSAVLAFFGVALPRRVHVGAGGLFPPSHRRIQEPTSSAPRTSLVHRRSGPPWYASFPALLSQDGSLPHREVRADLRGRPALAYLRRARQGAARTRRPPARRRGLQDRPRAPPLLHPGPGHLGPGTPRALRPARCAGPVRRRHRPRPREPLRLQPRRRCPLLEAALPGGPPRPSPALPSSSRATKGSAAGSTRHDAEPRNSPAQGASPPTRGITQLHDISQPPPSSPPSSDPRSKTPPPHEAPRAPSPLAPELPRPTPKPHLAALTPPPSQEKPGSPADTVPGGLPVVPPPKPSDPVNPPAQRGVARAPAGRPAAPHRQEAQLHPPIHNPRRDPAEPLHREGRHRSGARRGRDSSRSPSATSRR